MNQPALFDIPTPPRSPCCKAALEHLHGHTWRCPNCHKGWTHKP